MTANNQFTVSTADMIAEKFNRAYSRINFDEILATALAMKLKYCWSFDEFVTKSDLEIMLTMNFSAFISRVRSDEAKGQTGETSVSSGGWTISLFWFQSGPQVQILFGHRFSE